MPSAPPSTTRFSSGDLDATQLAAFVAACPQAVGLYLAERANVLAVCQELAASVGAQVVVTSTGLLRLIPAISFHQAVLAAASIIRTAGAGRGHHLLDLRLGGRALGHLDRINHGCS